MKRLANIIAVIGVMTTMLSACKLDKPDFTDPNAFKSANSSSGSGSNSGSGSVTPTGSQSNTYMPVTKDTYWKYASTGLISDTTTNTITGSTTTFNNKVYYNESSVSQHYKTTSYGYLYSGNHIYSMKSTTFTGTATVEFLYLNDTTSIGHSWTTSITDDGTLNGVPAQLIGTMMEKGISKTLYNKTFTNVIHTQLNLQYDMGLGAGFESYALYDFYIAKGIGIIEIDSSVIGLTSTLVLYDYSIK